MSSNEKEVLYDKFIQDLPPEDGGAPSTFNNITENLQSNYDKIKKACTKRSESTEDSIKSKEGDQDASPLLIKTEAEKKQFLKKIYEPVERSKVHGFDYDEKSLKMLLLNEKSLDSFKLIGVVGVLGVGKTTLCRLIFNDEEVKQRFVPRIWISMPAEEESKSMGNVVETMLEHLGVEEEIIKSISENHKLPGLLYALHLNLTGKRFLIVLDNVRTDKYYDDLVCCLSSGHGFPKKYGGAVIMTSRNEEAVKKMVAGDDQNYIHRLLPLSDPENCWAIYQNWDLDEAKKIDGQGRPPAQDSKPSDGQGRPPAQDSKPSEGQDSGGDGSKEIKPEAKMGDVSDEVKKELKKKCGGFPLVVRMMREIKELQNKQNDAVSGQTSTTSSKNGLENEANTTIENSPNESIDDKAE